MPLNSEIFDVYINKNAAGPICFHVLCERNVNSFLYLDIINLNDLPHTIIVKAFIGPTSRLYEIILKQTRFAYSIVKPVYSRTK